MSSEILLRSKITQSKALYESKLIESFKTNHSQVIYHYIWAFTDQNVIPSIVTRGEMCAVSDYHKAYQYFHSVFTKSSICLPL